MKIGFLHSWQQKDLWNSFNAILIRHQYETWNYARFHNLNYWRLKYGKGSSREKLRDLIYNHTNQDFLLLAQHYDMIFLSMNFDIYPPSEVFREFVRDIVSTYRSYYPYKEIILGAGNETQEKRKIAEKVIQVCQDVKDGSAKYGIDICSFNQKIKTSEEKEVLKRVLNSQLHKSICKYLGFQSLATSAENTRIYTQLAQSRGYEVIDTELGTETDRFSEIKMKFDNDRLLGIDKVFILTPEISKELADYRTVWKKYALQILRDNGTIYQTKPKYAIIDYVQKYKTFTNNEQREVLNKMLDNIAFKNITKMGCRGLNTKRIQYILNDWIKQYDVEIPLLITDGIFGKNTETAVKLFQVQGELMADGIVGKNSWTALVKFLLG